MKESQIARILDALEKYYGKLRPVAPTRAYEMLVYAICGYPANDATCTKGYEALTKGVGIHPEQILAATDKELTEILRLGGIVPEVRAQRLKEIAVRVQDQYGGDLDAALRKPLAEPNKVLKQFPTIAEPGAEKILLFTGMAPVAAVPSNCVHVPLRLGIGSAHKTYSQDYRSAQQALEAEVPETRAARLRAYLLLQRHGQELCKRSRPKCDECPVTADCRYFRATR